MPDGGTPQPQGPLNKLARDINRTAKEHGFWEADRNVGEMLMLVTSELAEAMEEHRAGKPDHYHMIGDQRVYRANAGCGADWSTSPGGLVFGADATWTGVRAKPEGFVVEVVDAVVRCLDILHSRGVDIDAIVAEKMAYNDSRPYKHGKAY